MILNVGQGAKSVEKKFVKDLGHIMEKLSREDEYLSRPQLIVVRRNTIEQTSKDQERERYFLEKVKSTGLFQNIITTLNFPYPGN